MRRWLSLAVLLAIVLGVDPPPDSRGSNPSVSSAGRTALSNVEAGVAENYGRLPLAFEMNVGQSNPSIQFISRSSGSTVTLTHREIQVLVPAREGELGSQEETLANIHTIRLVGADEGARILGRDPLKGTVNYFVGQDPAGWISGVPTFAGVEYRDAYPGIDLLLHGVGGRLEYDFVVSAGGDPAAIRLSFPGAGSVGQSSNGTLNVRAGRTVVKHEVPFAYQEVAGRKLRIDAAFVVYPNSQVGFALGTYDTSRPIVIDPVLSFSTYLGGSDSDGAFGLAVDHAGSAYVVGQTWSLDFPTKGGLPEQKGLMFVTKFTPDGTGLVYSTYLGGSDYEPSGLYDTAWDVEVDQGGNAFVTGQTRARDFPVKNAFQGQYQGGFSDAFVTKFDPSGGSLVYSTYLGGEDEDWARALALDADGIAYVTGYTNSYLFPLKNPLPMESTKDDAFVTKLDSSGSALVYSTRFGGYTPFMDKGSDAGYGISIDANRAIIFAGSTESSVFPLKNPIQPDYGGGDFDGFIAKLSSAGDSIVFSTFFGGSIRDEIQALALGPGGAAYVTGHTDSADFPVRRAIEQCGRGFYDAFAARIGADGTLGYSTYLGGSSMDEGTAIAVDAIGTAYIVGKTESFDFPMANPLQNRKGQGIDAFVTALASETPDCPTCRFPSRGPHLVFSSPFGGGVTSDFYFDRPNDAGLATALDRNGDLYLAGWTSAPDFPLMNAYQAQLKGPGDAFVTKISKPGGRSSGFHKGCMSPVDFAPFENHDTGSWPESVAIGDVTGDGRKDALMTTSHYLPDPDDHKLLVYPQRPDGSLGAPIGYPTHDRSAESEYGIAVGDLDGDGLADAAVAVAPGIDIYLQRLGGFTGPSLISVPGTPQHLEAADVTGDGRNDLVVATRQGVVLLRNTGSSFDQVTISTSPQLEVEVGDVTGDGRPDIVGCTEPKSIHVYAQNADGSFGAPQDYVTVHDGRSWPSGLEIADTTGDGRNDVVVTVGWLYINVFPQTPSGELGAPTVHQSYGYPGSVESGDLNADGRLDVAILHDGLGVMSVNLQEPDGALAPYSTYTVAGDLDPTRYRVKGIDLGDLNGDGRLDVAIADYINGLVVLYQTGQSVRELSGQGDR